MKRNVYTRRRETLDTMKITVVDIYKVFKTSFFLGLVISILSKFMHWSFFPSIIFSVPVSLFILTKTLVYIRLDGLVNESENLSMCNIVLSPNVVHSGSPHLLSALFGQCCTDCEHCIHIKQHVFSHCYNILEKPTVTL